MRLIDADALTEKYGDWYVEEGPEDGFIGTIKQLIDTQPTIQSDTTTHDSIPAKTGINDGDRTSGDCINRQQAINKIKPWSEVKGYSWGELNMLRAVINELENMPSAQPETNCSEFPNNSDTISRQAAIDALHMNLMYRMGTDSNKKRLDEWINNLPSAQPERKDAIEKAVAVEAISDEIMSRFDISATYAYEVAEKAMNRIEEMAKKMGKR